MQLRRETPAPSRPLHRRLSVNDWVTLSYLVLLNLAWLGSAPSAELARSGPWVGLLLIGFSALVFGYSRRVGDSGFWNALTYRVGHFGAIQGSYFVFKTFLPAVNPDSLDTELLAFDLAVFGGEPAMALSPWVSSMSTEWFSFFYYSYFFLLASHIFSLVFFAKDHQVLCEFALGLTLVSTVGHSCYLLVPGFGPYIMQDAFSAALPDGLWWRTVVDLVEQGGAQKDIFPSLHTAIPTFILLFSYHNRSLYPYRLTWPLLGVAAANIIIATMFLRWHYLIDVVVGLTLATLSYVVAVRVTAWETLHRSRLGLGRVWPAWSDRSRPALVQDTPAQNPS